jgi:hypothetical protein
MWEPRRLTPLWAILAAFSVSWSFAQSVGLLGRGINPSQYLYLHTEQYTHRHPCLEWDSNSGSQRSSERRPHDHYDRRSYSSTRTVFMGVFRAVRDEVTWITMWSRISCYFFHLSALWSWSIKGHIFFKRSPNSYRLVQHYSSPGRPSPYTHTAFFNSRFILLTWKWRQDILPKRQKISTELHSVTSQKTAVFVVTTVRTSELTRSLFVYIFHLVQSGRMNQKSWDRPVQRKGGAEHSY